MDLQLATQRDYDVGTWVGLANAGSLITSFAWALVARRSYQYDCFLALLCTGHLTFVAPTMYISSVYVQSRVFVIANNLHTLLSNFLFVSTGMMLVGKDAVSCGERATAVVLLYLFFFLIAFAESLADADEDPGSNAGKMAHLDFLIWVEPIVNSLCLLWFVVASVYRYTTWCTQGNQYTVCSKRSALGLQLGVTVIVFVEKSTMYMVINQGGEILWWRIAHWIRTVACQSITYALAKRNEQSQITFRP